MEISSSGIDLIKNFEGCFLKTYDDGTGVLTIGYGHTYNVKWGDTITMEQAIELLKEDLKYASNCVQALINNKTISFDVNQNMFDSLVSFTFNCGQGSLQSLVKGRNKSTVADKMLLYVMANGKPLQGLVNRRKAERELFLKDSSINLKESVKVQLIKFGEKSKRVTLIQLLLNQILNWSLDIDGDFGNNTLRAVKEYQRIRDLTIDGLIGEQTANSILSDTKNILCK